MEKRVFICTHSQMPIGDANSNYIFHMALALAHEEWNVIVFGASRNNVRYEGESKGIKFVNLPLRGKIQGHSLFGKSIMAELKKNIINENDYVIIYGGYLNLFSELGKKLKFMRKGHVLTCVVEWPTAVQFDFGRGDPNYLLWQRVFYKWMPYWSKTIVISRNLRQYFESLNCKTFLLPPMIDCKNKQTDIRVSKPKIQFIYSGADEKKDSIINMMLAIRELSSEERERFEFHITSLTEKKAEKLLGVDKKIIQDYKECIYIHGWMEYEDLVELYSSMDYLLLARTKNRFTLSNFPSKVPEMMNYGIIPVCSRVGDYTEVFLHNMENSVIFDGDSAKQCSIAIKEAISISDELRTKLSNNAQRTAQEQFDFRSWGDKLSKFILE